jgi:ABC-type uncharacterized transport system permease subunit
MPDPVVPSLGQLVLLGVDIGLFLAGSLVSFLRLRWNINSLRLSAKALGWSGIVAGLALIIWHSWARQDWRPLGDNFEALIWLALLLAALVLYVQRTQVVAGLDWFALPLVIVLLLCAGVFGRLRPLGYNQTAWTAVHVGSCIGWAVAFAVAGATSGLYLIASRRLRRKSVSPGPRVGSLERLERIIDSCVTLGFALLTVGLITGLLKIIHDAAKSDPVRQVILSGQVIIPTIVWLVYALLLHTPISPSLRGRKTAWLGIVGLALMLGTMVVIQFMPAAAGGGQ